MRRWNSTSSLSWKAWRWRDFHSNSNYPPFFNVCVCVCFCCQFASRPVWRQNTWTFCISCHLFITHYSCVQVVTMGTLTWTEVIRLWALSWLDSLPCTQRNLVIHVTVFMINTRFRITASYLHVLLWWLLFTARTAAVRAAASNQGKFSNIQYKPQYSVFCQSSVGCNSKLKSLLTSPNGEKSG